MTRENVDRRDFLRRIAVTGSAAAAALTSSPAQQPPQKKMIGIQVGAISFLDEGVEPVLDIFQQSAQHQHAVSGGVYLWPRHRRAASARAAAARPRQTGVRSRLPWRQFRHGTSAILQRHGAQSGRHARARLREDRHHRAGSARREEAGHADDSVGRGRLPATICRTSTSCRSRTLTAAEACGSASTTRTSAISC